jgi:hypothetical protein
MLTHQLTLVLHHSSVIFQHKGLIHHPLEVLKILSLQSIGQPIIQAIQETLLFLLISVDFMRGVVSDMDPYFRSRNYFFFSLITPWGT